MKTPVLRVPVVCPECGRESLVTLPMASVAAGLMNGIIELQGHCDHQAWRATDLEREQIREYLAAPMN